ncbi:hypothetical protein CLV80_102395 [Yoonia maritima]|uniref:Uncharacterized protein n=1 Tax=Yoonia maritima TaxID=1435347 RepID=A0A2T0W3H2_9RHOB|nr:hypothetical protein [Yoonia maritima]PRY79749.1 hypothetical protein CLV80_102395 [Yoonia maritima]
MSYLSSLVSSIAGLILFCIGAIGLSGVTVNPSPSITVLLSPMGYGDHVDSLYYWGIVFLGFWLVLYVFVRPAALTALAMVLGKSLVLKGWVPLLGVMSL